MQNARHSLCESVATRETITLQKDHVNINLLLNYSWAYSQSCC